MERLICIVGPTASGKTRLAVELARALDGEVVSCDSMAIYRGMDIGTAKPTIEERRGVPHHMIDVADPREAYSVGRYVAEADACIRDILARGKRPILAGGTGLYADSLVSGRDFAPRPESALRQTLERRADNGALPELLEELRRVDPETAARLAPGDRRRILRALEIFQVSGEPMSVHDARTRALPPRYRPLWIGLDFLSRADLYARIDRRVDEMLRQGLLDEIRALLTAGVPPEATAMQAIGYKEFVPVLRGEATLEAARAQVQQGSRRYAKRQLTWFRRNPDIHWLRLPEKPDFSAVFAEARSIVAAFDRAQMVE